MYKGSTGRVSQKLTTHIKLDPHVRLKTKISLRQIEGLHANNETQFRNR